MVLGEATSVDVPGRRVLLRDGVVPYDFRLPTLERLRAAYWDPSSDVIFTDHVFGVGWAVNVPVAARKLAAMVDQYGNASRALRSRASSREDG